MYVYMFIHSPLQQPSLYPRGALLEILMFWVLPTEGRSYQTGALFYVLFFQVTTHSTHRDLDGFQDNYHLKPPLLGFLGIEI